MWDGGPVGVLLSHGYTATTAEVRPLAKLLRRRGFTVAGPLLPGHGSTPQAMNGVSWQEWVVTLEEAYQQLTQRCRYVFIGGESMGGALALFLASQHPEAAGVLLYSPAVKIPVRPLMLSYLVRPFIAYKEKDNINSLHPDWKGYRVNPIPAVHQMHRLQRRLWPLVPKMRLPLLIVQGRHDFDIDLRGVERLFELYPTPVKEFYWMEQSGHVVILDKERAQVAEITTRFMLRALASRRTVA